MASASKRVVKERVTRGPQQARSRASLARVLDAAEAIVREKGLDGVTLSEVSRRAGASIGSIYGRFEGKDELIRVVLLRALDRINVEGASRLERLRESDLPLATLVPRLLDTVAEGLSGDAALLRACMQRAVTDRQIGEAGREGHSRLEREFTAMLLARRREIRHPDPELAATTCFVITWSTLARHLGFGMIRPLPEETNWGQVRAELGAMFSLYLRTDPSGSSAPGS